MSNMDPFGPGSSSNSNNDSFNDDSDNNIDIDSSYDRAFGNEDLGFSNNVDIRNSDIFKSNDDIKDDNSIKSLTDFALDLLQDYNYPEENIVEPQWSLLLYFYTQFCDRNRNDVIHNINTGKVSKQDVCDFIKIFYAIPNGGELYKRLTENLPEEVNSLAMHALLLQLSLEATTVDYERLFRKIKNTKSQHIWSSVLPQDMFRALWKDGFDIAKVSKLFNGVYDICTCVYKQIYELPVKDEDMESLAKRVRSKEIYDHPNFVKDRLAQLENERGNKAKGCLSLQESISAGYAMAKKRSYKKNLKEGIVLQQIIEGKSSYLELAHVVDEEGYAVHVYQPYRLGNGNEVVFIAFRGTDASEKEWIQADVDPNGVAYALYQEKYGDLLYELDTMLEGSQNNIVLHLSGHSAGAALVQRLQVTLAEYFVSEELQQRYPNLSKVVEVDGVKFNAPNIEAKLCIKFSEHLDQIDSNSVDVFFHDEYVANQDINGNQDWVQMHGKGNKIGYGIEQTLSNVYQCNVSKVSLELSSYPGVKQLQLHTLNVCDEDSKVLEIDAVDLSNKKEAKQYLGNKMITQRVKNSIDHFLKDKTPGAGNAGLPKPKSKNITGLKKKNAIKNSSAIKRSKKFQNKISRNPKKPVKSPNLSTSEKNNAKQANYGGTVFFKKKPSVINSTGGGFDSRSNNNNDSCNNLSHS